MKKHMIALGLSGLIVAGCASHAPIISSPIQPGDAQLTCSELQREMALAHKVLEKAKRSGNGASEVSQFVEGGVGLAEEIARHVPGGEGVSLAVGTFGRLVSAAIGMASRSSREQDHEKIKAAAGRIQMLGRMYSARCAR